jgi:hypothetical protein
MDASTALAAGFAGALQPKARCLGLGFDDTDEFTPSRSLDLELDHAVLQREQGVVPTTAHVNAVVEARAPLPHQDAAGLDLLAAEPLDAETL